MAPTDNTVCTVMCSFKTHYQTLCRQKTVDQSIDHLGYLLALTGRYDAESVLLTGLG